MPNYCCLRRTMKSRTLCKRTRAVGRENTVEVSILECDILPELQDIRLDTFSLDELNFFAKRLASLPNEELPVFYAVTEQIFGDAEESENPVSIKDLINCTYGLDTVPVAHNVSNSCRDSVGLPLKTVCFPISMTFPKARFRF